MDKWWESAPLADQPQADKWWEAAPVAPAMPETVASDVAKSAGVGLAKGAMGMAGAPGDISSILGRGATYAVAKLAEKAGLLPNGRTADELLNDVASLNLPRDKFSAPTTGNIEKLVTSVAGPMHTPQTTAGKYAETAASFIPGSLLAPGGAVRNAAQFGIIPGVASEAAGQLTAGTAAEPWARLVGGIGGALTGPSILNVPGRIMSPLSIPESRRAAVAAMKAEGVPLTAGQATGHKPLQWMESVAGDAVGAGGKAAAIQAEQGEAFTAAALRRAGIQNEGRATPDVMSAARDRIGGKFNDLTAQNTLRMDEQFSKDFGRALRDYVAAVPPSMRAPGIGGIIDDVMEIARQGGKMAGESYQQTRSQLAKRAEGLRMSDPPQAEAYRGIRKAFDAAMDRSISPADAQAWGQARREYGNLKTLEKAAGAAGTNAAEGLISPSQLRAAVAGGNKRGAYSRGEGDFADLARSGVATMTPLPQSGTAPRAMMQGLMSGGGALAGGLPGLAASMVGPAIAGRALMSRPLQTYLQNDLAHRIGLLSDIPQSVLTAGILASAQRGAQGLLSYREPRK